MISTTSTYGIRAVCYLAGQPTDRFVPIREISDEANIPFQYLTKLLQRLQNEGLIISRRGNTGGVTLARLPEQISLIDILAVLEPGFVEGKCLIHDRHCPEGEWCAFGVYWRKVQSDVHRLLRDTDIGWVANYDRSNSKPDNSGLDKSDFF